MSVKTPALKIGTTLLIFMKHGYLPILRQLLKRLHNGIAIDSITHFTFLTEKLSIPPRELLFFMALTIFIISCSDVGNKYKLCLEEGPL